MTDITTDNLIKRLDAFSWKKDKPKRWSCSKFAVQITISCLWVSFMMFVVSVWMGLKEIYELLMVIGIILHVITGLITVFTLWHVAWVVLKKIAPEADVCLRFELDKKKSIKHALITTLVIVAIGVVVNIKFVFLSGVVMAIVGCIYSVIFMCRVGKYFPIDFFYALKRKYLQETAIFNVEHSSGERTLKTLTEYGVNPANNSTDVNDNVFCMTSRFHDVHIPFENGTATSFLLENNELESIKFNPASGLPMMNDSFDINGDVFGTTSRFYDEPYHLDDYHHSHDNHSWDDRW